MEQDRQPQRDEVKTHQIFLHFEIETETQKQNSNEDNNLNLLSGGTAAADTTNRPNTNTMKTIFPNFGLAFGSGLLLALSLAVPPLFAQCVVPPAGVGWVPVDANNLQFGEEGADFIAMVLGDETPLVPHPHRGLQGVGLQGTWLEAVGGEGPGSKREARFVCVALPQPKH